MSAASVNNNVLLCCVYVCLCVLRLLLQSHVRYGKRVRHKLRCRNKDTDLCYRSFARDILSYMQVQLRCIKYYICLMQFIYCLLFDNEPSTYQERAIRK